MATKEYAGGAANTLLAAGINASVLTFSVTVGTGTGHPTGATGNFWIEIGYGLPTLEKIRCSGKVGDAFTVAAGGRGGDGTVASSHQTGEIVRHVLVSEDAREANAHVNDVALDHHSQYLNTLRHDVTGRHVLGSPYLPRGTALDLAGTVTGATGTFADGAHTHGFPAPTSYTPLWNASTPPSVGNGTILGQYVRVGKMMWVAVFISSGTTTSYGLGTWQFYLPGAGSTLTVPGMVQRLPAYVAAGGSLHPALATFVGGTAWATVDASKGGGTEQVAQGALTPAWPVTWAGAGNWIAFSGWLAIQ